MLELLKDEDLDIRMAAVTGVCAILRQLITHLLTSCSSIAGPHKNLTNFSVLYSFFFLYIFWWVLDYSVLATPFLCCPFCILKDVWIRTQRAAVASRRYQL